MSIEGQQTPDQGMEEVFGKWFAESRGNFFLDENVVPKDVFKAIETYEHFKANDREEGVVEKIKEAADEFENLTGFKIEDFIKYQEEQNRMPVDSKE